MGIRNLKMYRKKNGVAVADALQFEKPEEEKKADNQNINDSKLSDFQGSTVLVSIRRMLPMLPRGKYSEVCSG